MKKRKKRHKVIPEYNNWIEGYCISRAFLDTAIRVCDKSRGDAMYENKQKAKEAERAGLVVAHVNFHYAVEIFLKTLEMIHCKRTTNGHSLWNLYQKLPQTIKDEIERISIRTREEINMQSFQFRALATNRGTGPPTMPENMYIKNPLFFGGFLEIWDKYVKPQKIRYNYEIQEWSVFCDALPEWSWIVASCYGSRRLFPDLPEQ